LTQDLRLTVAAQLDRARNRTTLLTETVDDTDLVRQHSPLMSPLVWDLAHVGNQEELWLVRDVGGREPVRRDIDELYDAFKHPRGDRPALPLLSPAEARAYVHQVRDKALDVLDRVRLDERRLVADGFAFGMIVQHEQQHDETMLATHQLRTGPPVLPAVAPPPSRGPVTGEVLIPGGPFTMGTDTEAWALHRRRAGHQRAVRTLHRGRRLRRSALVERARLGAPPGRRADRADALAARRGRLGVHAVRAHRADRGRRAGRPRVLLRGAGVRVLGRPPAAPRGGVGEGGPLRPGHRAVPALPVG
jgi:DinB family protein